MAAVGWVEIQRAHVHHVPVDRDAAVVGTAAVRGDRSHLVLVVPELGAGLRVQRVHVIERRRRVHDPVDDDGRRLHGLHDLGLEDPGRPQLVHVRDVDLAIRVVAGLLVVPVGVQEVVAVAAGAVWASAGSFRS